LHMIPWLFLWLHHAWMTNIYTCFPTFRRAAFPDLLNSCLKTWTDFVLSFWKVPSPWSRGE
jgi:hypothetical protein